MQTTEAWSPQMLSTSKPLRLSTRATPLVIAIGLNAFIVYKLGVGLHAIPIFDPPKITMALVPDSIADRPKPGERANIELPKTISVVTKTLIEEEPMVIAERLPHTDNPPADEQRDTTGGGIVAVPETPIVAPRIQFTTEPRYPTTSRHRDEEGVVYVRVMVSPYGDVVDTQLEKSSGYTRLDGTAVKAVRGWRFSPSMRGTEAVAGSTVVLVRFRLQK